MSTLRGKKAGQPKPAKQKVTLEAGLEKVQYGPLVTKEELARAAKRGGRSRSPHRPPSESGVQPCLEEEEEAAEAAASSAMSIINQTSSLAEAIELLKQMVSEITNKSPQEQMMKDIKEIKETLNKLEVSIAALSRHVHQLSLSGLVGKAIPSTDTVSFSPGATLYPPLPGNVAGPSAPPPPTVDDYPF
uniref:Phosphoprotein n=1 Tax=Murray-Darling carp cultervirus TaxID=2830720 RepID=A0AA48SG51_9MONO|nr:TPA_asm: phosphoprotein [Murray-Darling carp cultervirus]